MGVFEVEVNGKTYEIDAPKQPTREEAIRYVGKATTQPEPDQSSGEPVLAHIGERLAGGYEKSDSAQESGPMRLLTRLAHPQSVGDLLGLLLPTQVGAQLAFEARPAYIAAAKAGYANAKTWKGVPWQALKSLAKEAFPNAENVAARQLKPAAGVVDRYMANTSPAQNLFGATPTTVESPAQAVFTKLTDGTWGIKGAKLVEGEPVHVIARSGTGQMAKVGKIVETADGM